jgi:hypothetical protein
MKVSHVVEIIIEDSTHIMDGPTVSSTSQVLMVDISILLVTEI